MMDSLYILAWFFVAFIYCFWWLIAVGVVVFVASGWICRKILSVYESEASGEFPE